MTPPPPILTQIQEAKRSIKHWKIQVKRTKPGSMGGGTIYIYIYMCVCVCVYILKQMDVHQAPSKPPENLPQGAGFSRTHVAPALGG